MTLQQFFAKFRSTFLWANLVAMAVVLVAFVLAVKVGLGIYTHHGEALQIPNVTHMTESDARQTLTAAGLIVEVNDTGYVKELPADVVLEQKPAAGTRVKSGHVVSLIVNASNTPTLTLPQIIENSSLREAVAQLKAMGFKVGTTQFITGEKDWVMGVTMDGRQLKNGDRVPVNKTIVVQVGNGMVADDDSLHYENSRSHAFDNGGIITDDDDFDDFEEI